MGRPRVLDDVKQREVCALVAAGMALPKVAMYVGCNVRTLRREREDNPAFDERMRRAQLAANLSPLEAMRRASGTHWRAAAWMLERQERRRQPGGASSSANNSDEKHRRDTQGQVRAALAEMHAKTRAVIEREVTSLATRYQIEDQLDLLFRIGPTGLEERAGGSAAKRCGVEGSGAGGPAAEGPAAEGPAAGGPAAGGFGTGGFVTDPLDERTKPDAFCPPEGASQAAMPA